MLNRWQRHTSCKPNMDLDRLGCPHVDRVGAGKVEVDFLSISGDGDLPAATKAGQGHFGYYLMLFISL